MILGEFVLKVKHWPQMHFTAIESEQRNAVTEIYAIDCTNQTKSRLLIYRTPDAQHAAAMMVHFRAWLQKANRGRTLRQEKSEVATAGAPFGSPSSRVVEPYVAKRQSRQAPPNPFGFRPRAVSG